MTVHRAYLLIPIPETEGAGCHRGKRGLSALAFRLSALGALRRPHGVIVAGHLVYSTAEANRAVARYSTVTDAVDWDRGHPACKRLHERFAFFEKFLIR